jgi:hypothetical protein
MTQMLSFVLDAIDLSTTSNAETSGDVDFTF